jgi:hypothetical protein
MVHPFQLVIDRQSEICLCGIIEQLHDNQISVEIKLALQLFHFLETDIHSGLGFEAAV